MIKSPRGSKNVDPQFSFTSQVTESFIHQNSDTSDISSPINNNAETENQLVWSNPIRNTLNPQLARQLAYSDTLLISCFYYYYYYY